MKISIDRTIPNTVVQLVNDREVWASRYYSLYRSSGQTSAFNKVLDVEAPLYMQAAVRIRLLARGMRLGIRSMRLLKSGTILMIACGKIFRYRDSKLNAVYSFDREFGPLREGWCEDSNGHCYLGEYFLNNGRKFPVKLLKSSDDGQSWQILRLFDNIRHIHCVQYDPFSGSIWLGTGDRDKESFLSFSTDGGMSWQMLGGGDQMFRTVSLLFTRDFVYWGSDAPTRQNYIYRYERQNGRSATVAAVDGPVHYSTVLSGGVMIFATTAEGNTEGKSAEWDKKAHIWASRDGMNWEDLISWEKDLLPAILGLGRVYFPHGENASNRLFFTLEALKSMDNKLVQASLSI